MKTIKDRYIILITIDKHSKSAFVIWAEEIGSPTPKSWSWFNILSEGAFFIKKFVQYGFGGRWIKWAQSMGCDVQDAGRLIKKILKYIFNYKFLTWFL